MMTILICLSIAACDETQECHATDYKVADLDIEDPAEEGSIRDMRLVREHCDSDAPCDLRFEIPEESWLIMAYECQEVPVYTEGDEIIVPDVAPGHNAETLWVLW